MTTTPQEYVTPLPYDSSEWTAEDWANRTWHLRYARGLLGQHIQLSVLDFMKNDFFEQTGKYLYICGKEVEDIDICRQELLRQMIEDPPKLRNTPKPTQTRLPSPTSVIHARAFEQAFEPEPAPGNYP